MSAALACLHRMPSLLDGALVFLGTGNAIGALVVAAAPALRRCRAIRQGHRP